jgi:exopolysaccharide production protein ExoQ
MSPSHAAVVYALGILGLFALNREPKNRTSWVLWIPELWLLIAGSRHVSAWLGMSPTASQAQYLEGSPLDATVYALLIAAAMIVLFGRRRLVASLLRKNWPIVLFVLYCALSVIWSDYPGVALKRWIKSLGDYATLLILLTERDRATAVKQVLARVAFVLLPLSVLFIKYYPELGRAYAAHWDSTTNYVGVADTKNMLGMVCLVFGFAASWRLLQVWCGPRRGRIKGLIVQGTVVGMAVWLLILSDSKTSLSCFVLTTAVIAAHTFFKVARKRVVVHILVFTVVLCCFSVLFLGVGGGALKTMGRNPTLTGRTDMWDVLLTVPINPILGTGFESFWLGKRLAYLWTFPIVDGITEAHNGYLEVYLNLGWVGVMALMGLLWAGYKNVLRLLDRDPEAGQLRLGYFVIAVVYNFTEAAIRSTDLVWIAFILAITALPERAFTRVPAAKTRTTTAALAETEQTV